MTDLRLERAGEAAASPHRQRALARAADARGDVDAALTHLAAACALGGAARDWLALGERLEGDPAQRALANALDALDDPESLDLAGDAGATFGTVGEDDDVAGDPVSAGVVDGREDDEDVGGHSLDSAVDDAAAADSVGDDEDDSRASDSASVALGVAERANALGLREIAEDALGVALLEDPPDELRRRFLRAARAALDPDPSGGELIAIPKAGRNDPCPCGSGTKYKRCHGALSRPAQRARLSDDALLLAIAMPYAGTEDGPGALEVLGRWVPRSGPVNVLAGTIAALHGERDEARRAFRSAARAAANDLELHHELLRALARIVKHDRDLALEMVEAAPAHGDPASLRLTAELWVAAGLPKAATELLALAKPAESDPVEREAILRALGAARIERGDHEPALRALDELSEPEAPDLARAALSAAWAGQPSVAERIERLRAAGWSDQASVAEGVAALVGGENERAAELLGKSLSSAGAHWRAEALDASGADAEAREARRDCTAGPPAGHEDLAKQIECTLALEGPDSARALADRYAFAGLQPIRAIARLALRLGDVDDARAGITHLLDQAPRDVETLLVAAEWRAGSGDVPAALSHLDAALALQPKRHRIRFARAELLRQLRRTGEALAALEQLARESPRNWRYRVAIAELRDETGDVERSRAEWRAAHRLAPDAPAVARAIGRIEGEDHALARAREEAERSVREALGDAIGLVHPDARAALVGAEQDWRSLAPPDDHSTVVTQLAKAVEIELMHRVFAPFRQRGRRLADPREDVGAFGKWCRGEIASLSIGEMAFAIGALGRDDVSPLLDAFRSHLSAATDMPWDLGERLAVPLRLLGARRNAAVHKEPVSRAEAEDSRRSVLGHADRRGILAEIVMRFAVPDG